MTKNEHGVYIDGFETFKVGDSPRYNIRVEVGEERGMWGYAISYNYKTEGTEHPFTDFDLKFVSRTDALNDVLRVIRTDSSLKSVFDAKILEKLEHKLFYGMQLSLF